jgi:hypothetical protein
MIAIVIGEVPPAYGGHLPVARDNSGRFIVNEGTWWVGQMVAYP